MTRKNVITSREILIDDPEKQCLLIQSLLNGLKTAMVNQVRFTLFMELVDFHLKADLIPPGLRIDIVPPGFKFEENPMLWIDWKQMLKDCSHSLMDLLYYHYSEEVKSNNWLKRSLKSQAINAIMIHRKCCRKAATAYVEHWINTSVQTSIDNVRDIFYQENCGASCKSRSDYQRKWIEEQSEFVQRLSLIEQEEQERTSKNRGSRPSTGKSTTRRLLDEEENELKYLHFVNEVTSDILSTGVYSDSVLYRLMERHVNKRIHELDEGKMWGVLDKLRKDLGMLEGRKKSSASASSQRQFKSGSIVLKDIEYSRERESSFSSRKDKKVSQMSPPGSISSMKSLKSVQNRKEDADFDSSFQQEKLKSLVKSSPVPHKRSSLSRASSSNANEFEKEISKTKRESTEVVDGEAKQSRASQRRASENSLKSRSNHDSIEELYAGSVSSKDLMEKNDAGNYRPSVAADRRRSSLGNVGSEFYVTSSGQLIDGRSSEDVVAEAVSEVASKVVVEVVESVKSGDGRVTPTPTQDLTVESALPPNEEESVTGYESDYESVAALSMVMKPKETSDDAMKSCPAIEPLVRKRGSSQAQRSKDCLFLPKEEETTKPLEHDGDDAYSDDFQEDSDDNF